MTSNWLIAARSPVQLRVKVYRLRMLSVWHRSPRFLLREITTQIVGEKTLNRENVFSMRQQDNCTERPLDKLVSPTRGITFGACLEAIGGPLQHSSSSSFP